MESLLNELELLTYKEEIEKLRQVCHNDDLYVEVRRKVDWNSRWLGVKMAVFRRDQEGIGEYAKNDSSRVIQKHALTAVAKRGDDDTVRHVFARLNFFDRINLVRSMQRTNRRKTLIDELLSSSNLETFELRHLLSFGSFDFVKSCILDHYMWLDLRQWTGLAKRHPLIGLQMSLKMTEESLKCRDHKVLEFCNTAIREGFMASGDLCVKIVANLHKFHSVYELPIKKCLIAAPKQTIKWVLQNDIELSSHHIPKGFITRLGSREHVLKFCKQCPWITNLDVQWWWRVHIKARLDIFHQCTPVWKMDKISPPFFHTIPLSVRLDYVCRKIDFDRQAHFDHLLKIGKKINKIENQFHPTQWWALLDYEKGMTFLKTISEYGQEMIAEGNLHFSLHPWHSDIAKFCLHFPSHMKELLNYVVDDETELKMTMHRRDSSRQVSKILQTFLNEIPYKLFDDDLIDHVIRDILEPGFKKHMWQVCNNHWMQGFIYKLFLRRPHLIADLVQFNPHSIIQLSKITTPLNAECLDALRQKMIQLEFDKDMAGYHFFRLVDHHVADIPGALEYLVDQVSLRQNRWWVQNILQQYFGKEYESFALMKIKEVVEANDSKLFVEWRDFIVKDRFVRSLDRSLYGEILCKLLTKELSWGDSYPAHMAYLNGPHMFEYLTKRQQEMYLRHLLIHADLDSERELEIRDLSKPLTLGKIANHYQFEAISQIPTIQAPLVYEWVQSQTKPEDAWVRSRLIHYLCNLDDRSAFDFVVKEFEQQDDPRDVIYYCVPILKRGERGEVVRLLQSMRMSRVSVAKEVCRLMGWSRTSECRRRLIEIFWDPLTHRDVKMAVIRSLWYYLQDEITWDFFDLACNDPDWRIAVKISHVTEFQISQVCKRRLLQLINRALFRKEPFAIRKIFERYAFGRTRITDPEGICLPGFLDILTREEYEDGLLDNALNHFCQTISEINEDLRQTEVLKALDLLKDYPKSFSKFASRVGRMLSGENTSLDTVCGLLLDRLIEDPSAVVQSLDVISLAPSIELKLDLYLRIIQKYPALVSYVTFHKHHIWHTDTRDDEKLTQELDFLLATKRPEFEFLKFNRFRQRSMNWADPRQVQHLKQFQTHSDPVISFLALQIEPRDNVHPGMTRKQRKMRPRNEKLVYWQTRLNYQVPCIS